MDLSFPQYASSVVSEVRGFLDSLHRPYTSDDVGQYVSLLMNRYTSICGEAALIPPRGNLFIVNGEAMSRFSGSLAGFFSTGDAQLLVKERIKDPDATTDIYGSHLDRGNNCPEGSPAQINVAMEGQRAELGRQFSVLGALTVFWSEDANQDLTRNYRIAGTFGASSIQAENIEDALESRYFNDPESLETLRTLNGLIRNSTTRLLGAKLLNMISWDEWGKPVFRSHFKELVNEASVFGPQWMKSLEFVFHKLKVRALISNDELDWEKMIWDEVEQTSPNSSPVLKSLLTLLDNGEDRLVGQFLDDLDSWNWGEPYALDDLIHVAAIQKPGDARRNLILQMLKMIDKENVDTSIVVPFVAQVVEMLMYPLLHSPTERNLAILVDRLFARQEGEIDLTGITGIETVSDFVKSLTQLYSRIFSDKRSETETVQTVVRSVQATVLQVAAAQRLNDVRLTLMRNAMTMPEAMSWDGRSSPWHFLNPLLDPDPKEQQILDEATSAWHYLQDYYFRHPENGGHGSGGAAVPPAATPAPQASNPPMSSMAFDIGSFLFVSKAMMPLYTIPVLMPGVFIH